MRQCENQNSSPQGYWTLGFRPRSHPLHGHLFLLPTIAGWACQGRCISATMTTWMYILYCNVVHLGGMTMFNKQPDKVIVFFSAAILSIPSSYEAYHLTTSLSSSPHSRCAQDWSLGHAGGLRPTHSNHKNHKHITRQPIYRRLQERRIKTCKDM